MRPRTLRHVFSRAMLLFALVAVGGCSLSASASARFFAPDSPWNAPLAADAKLDDDSSGMSQELSRQVAQYGPWINSTQFSVPIYTVPADQPGVSGYVDNNHDMFTNDQDAIRLKQRLDGVPIPRGAKPARRTDRHIVIWQPSPDTMWEMWLARNPADGGYIWWRNNSPGWHVAWGARIDQVSSASGVNPYPYGATASGLALAGGLITNEDLERGYIDHAVAMAIPAPKGWQFVPPATRTDGRYTGDHAIPEGTRFRLPANLDIAAMGLRPVTRMIAEAAQRYGILVRDYAGAVVFYAEDPFATGNGIFSQRLGGQSPAAALASFPWSRLQVVDPVQPAPPPPSDPVPPPADPAPPAPDATPPALDPAPPTGDPAPPAADLPPAPAPTQPPTFTPTQLAPALSASVRRTQRIRTVLRRGVRVKCRHRPGERCAAKLTVGRVTVTNGSRLLTSPLPTIVRSRVTHAGRVLLRKRRRRIATLTVSAPGSAPVTRQVTLVP